GRLIVSEKVANTRFGGPNPRTALGVDRQGHTLWIVVVDGRQAGLSVGVTLVELACLFQTLGVWDALNLDGGGSSTFVMEDADGLHTVVNTPVGRGRPNTLRQVANNLGLYLPGTGVEAETGRPRTLREAVIRAASSRRGGGYSATGQGVSRDITYDGQTVLRANPQGTYCCGATLEVFLDAYCRTRHGYVLSEARGRWFENWPREKFVALQQGWYGTDEAQTNPLLPEEVRPAIREKQLYHVLPWTGLATPVENYRLLRRGDFVQFWRKNGTGHSAIFWGRDRDKLGRERLWYWSSQRQPRYAYPLTPGGQPVRSPGYGINWEYIGDEIDPARIHGVSPVDTVQP
ncbi:MAG: phosphodiester glycosidase family protein, partial [Phycisphaerae bacterium]